MFERFIERFRGNRSQKPLTRADVEMNAIARLEYQLETTFGLQRRQAVALRGLMKTIEHANQDGFMTAEFRLHALGLASELQGSGVSFNVIRQAVGESNLNRYDINLSGENQ